ncbi:hypothetical protein BGW36DRAFT_353261 [Talaromyces proteolyticus]|uniref:Transcription factor domain-containing protein n=1 Tax=Talaromyces proteolyticus TaxID=1131652 RepID=A0AAD4L2K7_9EURO|nr:uncharacterized protein BGW36DRAFT_353261 [Talaromyces proteolyticus]KAH8704813.1 hypothetical protein BGW36DRAFT_353261 [Talaromyces proteolyticus]
MAPSDKATSAQPPFIFVQGSSIKEGRNGKLVRSQLARRIITKKRLTHQKEQMQKLDRLLQKQKVQSTEVVCFCSSDAASDASLTSPSLPHKSLQDPEEPKSANVVSRTLLPKTLATIALDTTQSHDAVVAKRNRPEPQSILGAGRIDPFMADSERFGIYFHDVADYCLKIFWPHLSSLGYAKKYYQKWIYETQSPALTHSLVYAASVYRDRLCDVTNPLNLREQQRHKDLAIKYLQSELTDSSQNGHVSDALLQCLLHLTVSENKQSLAVNDPSAFTTPFGQIQGLDIYGSCNFHPLHWDALVQCVERRGGIHTVKLCGVSYFLSLASLFNACINLSRPVFPVLNAEGQPVVYSTPLEMLRIPEAPQHLNQGNGGFHQLCLLNPPVKRDTVQIFLDLSELSQVIQYMASRTGEVVDLATLGDCRNLVQHQLLELPGQPDDLSSVLEVSNEGATAEETNTVFQIYLACRLAALLYSLHATFPLPRTAPQRDHLIPALQNCISGINERYADLRIAEILLWCAVTGGATAYGSKQRLWFLGEISRLCDLLKIHTWDQMLECLVSFSWIGSACNQAGQALWREVNILYDGKMRNRDSSQNEI